MVRFNLAAKVPLVLPLLWILIAACAGPTMTVRSEHDPEALSDFGRYRTYAWQPPGGRLPGGPFVRQTITTTREFNQGTLILDIADGRTGRHVWRGWAQAEIQASADPGERETRIRAAVRKILDEFPPKQ